MFGLLKDQPACGNEEVHMFHYVDRVETRSCDGYVITECRERVQIHPEHTYDVNVSTWCDGVCSCVNSEGKHDHGPGRHK